MFGLGWWFDSAAPPTRNEHRFRAQKIPLAHIEEAAGVEITLTV